MKQEINPKYFQKVCSELIASNCRSVVQYVDKKTVVKATWQRKPSGRTTNETMLISFGAPNYLERIFVKQCIKAGEPFPVKKIQLRPYPKKRVVK